MAYLTSPDQEQFQQLQEQLRQLFQSSEQEDKSSIDLLDEDDRDILVIPSLSIDQHQLSLVSGFIHYEERLLFSLIRLRNPLTRLIYVTSCPIAPDVIDYYLQLLPGIPFSHARERLLLLSTYDSSLKPLSQKILDRPRLIDRIRRSMRPHKSYMVCYNSSFLEQELSLKLGIPLFASSPELLYWGSKSGSREIFAEANIPHPDGSFLVHSVTDLLGEINALWERQPHLQRLVIKLNEGFSGEGNAVLDLEYLAELAPGRCSARERKSALGNRLSHLTFPSRGTTWETFASRISELGVIVEAFLEGDKKRSPSVQGYITPTGRVEIISTHDQILGGTDQQIYLGCRFPADQSYRLQLQELGLKVGEVLAKKGAIERYGVDFIATPDPEQPGQWKLNAIEINLRKGGTTHPFMALKLLTNGYYNLQTGLFHGSQGQPKYYIATDNLQKKHYHGLLPNDLMDIITRHRLHFDSSTRTGSVFHLVGALSEFGKLGLTSIGNSLEEAEALFQQVEQVLDAETLTPSSKMELLSPPLPIAWRRSD